MKKRNLLISCAFILMAVLVIFASTMSVCAQAESLTIQAAASRAPQKLFHGNGKFAVDRGFLEDALHNDNMKLDIFGYDWRVVNYTDDVLTVWMDTPYRTYQFNDRYDKNDSANNGCYGAYQNANNTWCNGYVSSSFTLDGQPVVIGESQIHKFLRDEFNNKILNNVEYAAYTSKVIAPNETNGIHEENCVLTKITPRTRKTDSVDNDVYDDVAVKSANCSEFLTANYTLTNEYWWLPSMEEVRENGLWGLSNSNRNYYVGASGINACWLRDAFDGVASVQHSVTTGSHLGILVGHSTDNATGFFNSESLFGDAVYKEYGVRPAMHISLATIDEDNGHNGGGSGNWWSDWWNDNLLKKLFVIVCVLGLIGVGLVIIAVIVKAHSNKNA